jgi:hypothetical protein
MTKVAKLALVALFAVMSMAALMASSAAASLPLFLTQSGKALLFTADSGLGTLRGTEAGVEATITCEKDLVHGFVLNASPLAHEVEIQFHTKCEQKSAAGTAKCSEPIKVKKAYGELGLLNGHVLLLLAPEVGTEFVEVTCETTKTNVSGAVIGEFDLNGKDGNPQYGVDREDFLLLFKAKGTTQEPEEIELLGTLMTKVGLSVTNFLGGKASEETVELILLDGLGLIDP